MMDTCKFSCVHACVFVSLGQSRMHVCANCLPNELKRGAIETLSLPLLPVVLVSQPIQG